METNKILFGIIIIVVSCILSSNTVLSIKRTSGLYIDNGIDQTEIEHYLSNREKKEIELEILELLGLPNRPRRIKTPLKKSAPQFMLNVYKSLMEKENEDHVRWKREIAEEDVNFSGEEQNAIEESDVIMTFESLNDHVASVRHERGKRLWFNVSEVPIAENIVGAELRIYQNQSLSHRKPPGRLYTVTVFQLVTDNGERELEYVTAINATSGANGWLGLNLTEPLSTWVAFPEANRGLYLSVHPVDKPGHEIRPEDIGLVTIRGKDETQPFMVAFLKATNHVKPRTARSVGRTRYARDDYQNIMKGSSLMDGAAFSQFESRRSCKINTLYIGFKDLKWQDWIIAPEGYSAFYCAGECNFPLNAHMNATNHAIVQTLVHLMAPTKYPKPCCAPTKLSPISVLYFLDDSNVILKKYKRMVVKSCGCH